MLHSQHQGWSGFSAFQRKAINNKINALLLSQSQKSELEVSMVLSPKTKSNRAKKLKSIHYLCR